MSPQATKLIYAIQIEEYSGAGLQVISVKIGQTSDIDNTLRQYQRANPRAKILDTWGFDPSIGENPEEGVHKLAERYAYKRVRETFVFLQDSYKEFRDHVNLFFPHIEQRILAEKLITSSKPISMRLFDKEYEVNTWRDVLGKVCQVIIEKHKDFTPALDVKGKKVVYFSKNPDDLRDPIKIEGSPYYWEGNSSAHTIQRIIKKLLTRFGYNAEKVFKVKTK